MIQITVGKKRTATFIPVDQFGNPNPVGADGIPLDVIGVPTWQDLAINPLISPGAPAAVTLVPAADGRSCDVIAVSADQALTINVTADRGDGVMVTGSSAVQTVGAAGPVSVISSLGIQWSEEKEV